VSVERLTDLPAGRCIPQPEHSILACRSEDTSVVAERNTPNSGGTGKRLAELFERRGGRSVRQPDQLAITRRQRLSIGIERYGFDMAVDGEGPTDLSVARNVPKNRAAFAAGGQRPPVGTERKATDFRLPVDRRTELPMGRMNRPGFLGGVFY
jgi:hypothetical protein